MLFRLVSKLMETVRPSPLNEITSENEWQEVVEKSKEEPVFVFKHSTACPISAGAHRQVTRYEGGRPVFMVKVIESRPISTKIAESTGVPHASPQLILLKDGAPAWNTSHGNITADAMQAAAE